MVSINRTLQQRSPSAGTLANPLPQLSSLPPVCPKLMNAALIPVYQADGMEPFLQQLTDLIQTEPTLAKWVVVPSQPHGVFLQVLADCLVG